MSSPGLTGKLLASGFDELRISNRWTITVMICFQTISPCLVIDRKEAKSRCKRSPFVIAEQVPMQIPDQRYLALRNPGYFLHVKTQNLTASHLIAAQCRPIIDAPSQGHAIFREQYRPISIVFAVILAEKPKPGRQDTPIPPLAGNVAHQPCPKGFVLKFVVPPDRQSKDMRCERIVVIEAQEIKGRCSLCLVNLVHQGCEELRMKRLVTNPIADPLYEVPEKVRNILVQRYVCFGKSLLELMDLAIDIVTQLRRFHPPFTNRDQIQPDFVGPIQIAAVVVETHHWRPPTLTLSQIMNQVISLYMGLEDLPATCGNTAQPGRMMFSPRELGAKIGIQHQHVWLIHRDIISNRFDSVAGNERTIYVENCFLYVTTKMVNHPRLQPRIGSEPGGMHKMMQGNNRLHPRSTTLR